MELIAQLKYHVNIKRKNVLLFDIPLFLHMVYTFHKLQGSLSQQHNAKGFDSIFFTISAVTAMTAMVTIKNMIQNQGLTSGTPSLS